MAHTKAYTTKLERDKYYHIFNRTVGDELLFRSDDNYLFFLRKYQSFLTESVETISYCLLPNHFHFFIRVIDEKSVSTNFKRLFQSYSLAYNRFYKRRGTLMERPFKRKEVKRNEHISLLIRYIHQNPQKHGIVRDFRSWKWSSFQEVFQKPEPRVSSDFMDNWFMSEDEYHSLHEFIETKGNME